MTLHDMTSMNSTVLMLPGIGNSGPAHWQSLWQNAEPAFVRVQQRDWSQPVCEEWVAALERTVASIDTDVVLVAHSLGCALVAHWAAKTHVKIQAALLVAPPDPDGPNFPKAAVGFSPLPMTAFAFPSIVVASSNDPYGDLAFSSAAASAWGSRFIDIGPAGHINSESGLGDWPAGFAFLTELTVMQ